MSFLFVNNLKKAYIFIKPINSKEFDIYVVKNVFNKL